MKTIKLTAIGAVVVGLPAFFVRPTGYSLSPERKPLFHLPYQPTKAHRDNT
jgi:hypothetical protein